MKKAEIVKKICICCLFLHSMPLFAASVEIQIEPQLSELKQMDESIPEVKKADNFKNFPYVPKKMAVLYNKNTYIEAENAIPLFNAWFKTNLKTKEELMTAITQLISHYYNNLRQCIPGIYNYPQPNILFGLKNADNLPETKYFYSTSIIYGVKENRCVVLNIFYKYDHPLRTVCLYSGSSLNFYTDEKAKAAAINYMRYEHADLNKIQQMTDECKVLPFNPTVS